VNITVKESVFIAAPPERVWDYTQDWTRRTEWDPAIVAAEVLPGEERVVRVRAQGGGSFLVRYKLNDRPNRTSLSMTDSTSRLVTGGGGSWAYEAKEGGTVFTQQNTLAVGSRLLAWFFGWMVRWQLRRLTRQALSNAKRIIEGA
jgi:uncharacterized protein YndB with AHSA1/START domain